MATNYRDHITSCYLHTKRVTIQSAIVQRICFHQDKFTHLYGLQISYSELFI